MSSFSALPTTSPKNTTTLFDIDSFDTTPNTNLQSSNTLISPSPKPLNDELEFKTIAHTKSPKAIPSGNGAVQYPDYMPNNNDSDRLLSGGNRNFTSSIGVGQTQSAIDPSTSFYSLSYYRRYFDVTTSLILTRLRKAMLPIQSDLFYESVDLSDSNSLSNSQPDMYAPFWIVNTLIVLLAANGNFSNWLQTPTSAEWVYNFNEVTVGVTVYYSVLFLIPIALYFALNKANQPLPLIHVMSIMGYSLVNYIPLSFLMLIHINLVQWILISLTVTVSSLFIAKNLWIERTNKQVMPIILTTAVIQAGLGLLTKFYFFD